MMRTLLALLVALAGLAPAHPAHAHKPSDSYLTIANDDVAISGQWDIALRDLDYAISLDSDDDGTITWGELRAHHGEIAAYAAARLKISGDGVACPLAIGEQLVDHHSDGAYTVLKFAATCPVTPKTLAVSYALLFDLDPQHRGLLRLVTQDATRSAIFSPEAASQDFLLSDMSRWRQFFDFGREGVWHIWIGFDHILFLVALLLPAVLRRERGKWFAAERFTAAFIDVFKIVTAFTIAHSITLSLAALGVLALPSRLVESTIAASVFFAALNNLFPLVYGKRWMVAFVFGLIHGFGFASVLADLGLPQDALLTALVGFNLGVEAGQLAIVAVFLPIAYVLRDTRFYRNGVLLLGSLLIAMFAAVWFIERAFDLTLLFAR